MKKITKQEAKDALKLTTDVALARLLEITPQSLTRTGPNDPLSGESTWKLRALRPRLFKIPPDERR